MAASQPQYQNGIHSQPTWTETFQDIFTCFGNSKHKQAGYISIIGYDSSTQVQESCRKLDQQMQELDLYIQQKDQKKAEQKLGEIQASTAWDTVGADAMDSEMENGRYQYGRARRQEVQQNYQKLCDEGSSVWGKLFSKSTPGAPSSGSFFRSNAQSSVPPSVQYTSMPGQGSVPSAGHLGGPNIGYTQNDEGTTTWRIKCAWMPFVTCCFMILLMVCASYFAMNYIGDGLPSAPSFRGTAIAVDGFMELAVDDPLAFVQDVDAKSAVQAAIAEVLNLGEGASTTTAAPRRLLEVAAAPRRLLESDVDVTSLTHDPMDMSSNVDVKYTAYLPKNISTDDLVILNVSSASDLSCMGTMVLSMVSKHGKSLYNIRVLKSVVGVAPSAKESTTDGVGKDLCTLMGTGKYTTATSTTTPMFVGTPMLKGLLQIDTSGSGWYSTVTDEDMPEVLENSLKGAFASIGEDSLDVTYRVTNINKQPEQNKLDFTYVVSAPSALLTFVNDEVEPALKSLTSLQILRESSEARLLSVTGLSLMALKDDRDHHLARALKDAEEEKDEKDDKKDDEKENKKNDKKDDEKEDEEKDEKDAKNDDKKDDAKVDEKDEAKAEEEAAAKAKAEEEAAAKAKAKAEEEAAAKAKAEEEAAAKAKAEEEAAAKAKAEEEAAAKAKAEEEAAAKAKAEEEAAAKTDEKKDDEEGDAKVDEKDEKSDEKKDEKNDEKKDEKKGDKIDEKKDEKTDEKTDEKKDEKEDQKKDEKKNEKKNEKKTTTTTTTATTITTTVTTITTTDTTTTTTTATTATTVLALAIPQAAPSIAPPAAIPTSTPSGGLTVLMSSVLVLEGLSLSPAQIHAPLTNIAVDGAFVVVVPDDPEALVESGCMPNIVQSALGGAFEYLGIADLVQVEVTTQGSVAHSEPDDIFTQPVIEVEYSVNALTAFPMPLPEKLASVNSNVLESKLNEAVKSQCSSLQIELQVSPGLAPLGPGFSKEHLREEEHTPSELRAHSNEGIVCIKHLKRSCSNSDAVKLVDYGSDGFRAGVTDHHVCRKDCEDSLSCGGFSYSHTLRLCFLHSAGGEACDLVGGLGGRWWVTQICQVGLSPGEVQAVTL